MSFKIRKIYDDFIPSNKKIIEQIIDLTRISIPELSDSYFDKMRSLFRNPVHKKMRYIFLIAEGSNELLKAFALMSYAKDLDFCFLDLIATSRNTRSGGVGSALYERVREEAHYLGADGIFLECMGDHKNKFEDLQILKQNQTRLKFYERYNAFPIICPLYEENSEKIYGSPYFLLYEKPVDKELLEGARIRLIVKAIIERKYSVPVSASVINKITQSIPDGPAQTRKPVYLKKRKEAIRPSRITADMKISLVYNELHIIHHIKERGYAESPVRVKNILGELDKTNLFNKINFRKYSDKYITAVHSKDFFSFFKNVTQALSPEKTLYPDVFPIRKDVKKPRDLVTLAGYYCIDIYSPINKNSYLAARAAVNCALTAADEVLGGQRISYALVRPPGHHADSSSFGGYCYFNSTAIAAHYLSSYGKVAILDIDFHHGNGQQEIFYKRNDVLTVSLHGDPDFEYPHFSGFKDEKGFGDGLGYNINYPLKPGINGDVYHDYLKKAVRNIKNFNPQFLVIAFGLDTAQGDPTGSWHLKGDDFKINGEIIGNINKPTLVIQEGGYNNKVLGTNARLFFTGLWETMYGKPS